MKNIEMGKLLEISSLQPKLNWKKRKLNLQKRIQEVENLIGDEKEILLKKTYRLIR